MMIGKNVDIYIEGMATALGVGHEEITPAQRQKFKVAFFQCMWWYLYRSDQNNRDWLLHLIEVFSMAIKAGRTFEETAKIAESLYPMENNK